MAAAICGSMGGGPKALPALLRALDNVPGVSEQWSHADGGIAFGCRSGQRPEGFAALYADRQAGLSVVVDARLDDRQALCDALGVAVAERGAVCDAALILRAWQQWGEECPRRLLGDYAFALWDGRRRALFCARDHVGARPFYYAVQGGAFLFGSTVEAVLAALGVSPALDEAVVATHLASSSTSSERSFFAAVRKLPPGCSLLVESPRNGAAGEPRLRRRRWWRPEDAPSQPPASDDAYAEQLLALCRQAVRDRLRGYGAGEVGAHLSGGLDSSSIAVLLARELRERGRPAPAAFAWLPALGTAAPKPDHAPEYALVDAVCGQERLRVCFGAPTPDDWLGVLRQDGAVPGIHVHPNEEIVQRNAAAAGARLLLSGWGGDECASFGGRGHLQGLLLRGRWRQLALECRAQDAALAPFFANVALPLAHPAGAAAPAAWPGGAASPLADRPRVRAPDPAADGSPAPAGGRSQRAAGAACQRPSHRAHGRLGGQLRPARHRVRLSAAGPAARGVRPGAAAGAVPTRQARSLAVPPRHAHGAAAGSLLERAKARSSAQRTACGRAGGAVPDDSRAARCAAAFAGRLRRHGEPARTPR